MTRTNPVQTGPVQTVGLPAAAFHHWIHSQEEDAAGVEAYRPEGFTLPPARGRTGFQLNPDGGFMQDEIGPADGGVQVSGRWTLRGPGQVAVSFPGTSRPGYLLHVMAVDDTVLRCRRDSVELPGQPAQDEGNGWTAYIDRQPPGPPRLHVHGHHKVPTGRFTVQLRRHQPPGDNPRDLLLDTTVLPPDDLDDLPIGEIDGNLKISVEVRYDEENSPDLDTVTILPAGVSVPVTEVS